MNDARFEAVAELVRQRQSSGRVLIARLMGAHGVEVSASGSEIRDHTGRRLIDAGSFSVFLLGHSNAAVVDAIAGQLHALSGSSKILLNELNAQVCDQVVRFAGPPMSRVMLLNGGAEAVEAALKLARLATGRSTIVHLEHAFHGKSLGALSVTDSAALRQGVGPLLPDVHKIGREDPEEAHARILQAAPAAVIVEPLQGEGGAFPISAEMLRAIRSACTEVGALMICDEIQCGLGRCGFDLLHRAAGIDADIVLLGKPLGGGIIPVSALVATEAAFAPFARDPLIHTSTFGGNPLACAAVRAVLRIVVEQRVAARAAEAGEALAGELRRIARRYPDALLEVRGRGLLLGLVFATPALAGEFMRGCVARGVLVSPCLTTPHVVRVTPSAFIRPEEHAALCSAIEASVSDCEP